MPLFSVIIALYNKENFIESTLKSALNQDFKDFEILIINDGSSDKSEEKVFQFQDARIRYFSKANEGASATRNFGIEKASGKYIAFLDADDYWYPTFLENMVAMIEKFPDEKVFSSAIELGTKNRIFKATYSIPKELEIIKTNFFKASYNQAAIFTSSAVFEKTVFNVAGNFDVTLKTDEDTDLWIRIGLKYPIIFSWKIGARYNYDKKGLSNDTSNYSLKTDFKKFTPLEKSNLELRKFLSVHRFSMALKSKMIGNEIEFKRFSCLLNNEDLSAKQRLLIKLPSPILCFIYHIKTKLENLNVRLSAFN